MQHSGPSLAPIPGPSQPQDWTLVSKGPKQHNLSSPNVGADPNSFHTLGLPRGNPDFSDTDCTPSPNPLMGKLKLIYEKASRQLKSKTRGGLELGQSSKKKIKRGGGANQQFNLSSLCLIFAL